MKKKFLAGVVIMIMVLALAGCGSEGTVNEDENVVIKLTDKPKEAEETIGTDNSKQAELSEETKEVAESVLIEGIKGTDVQKLTDESKPTEEVKEPDKVTNTSKPTESPQPTDEPNHTNCSWDSGKVTATAGCNNEGTTTYTCTICGNQQAEIIQKTAHNLVTETKIATCMEAAGTRTYCSICGMLQSEVTSGNPTGHSYVKEYWPAAPTCEHGGYYNEVCERCGELGGSGNEPKLPHTPVTVELCHGDCVNDTVTETSCGVCGASISTDAHTEADAHDWIEGTYEEFDYATHQVITKTNVKCSRCGILQ